LTGTLSDKHFAPNGAKGKPFRTSGGKAASKAFCMLEGESSSMPNYSKEKALAPEETSRP